MRDHISTLTLQSPLRGMGCGQRGMGRKDERKDNGELVGKNRSNRERQMREGITGE